MKLSRFRIAEIWRSALSWMHWRRRRNQRELEKLEQMLDMFQQPLAAQRHRMLEDVQTLLLAQRHRMLEDVRTLLLEALQPMAEAMQRQDGLLELRTDAIEQRLRMDREETTELLTEVLNSLQPSSAQQILGASATLKQPRSPYASAR